MSETTRRRKLIEVALPLDEINVACKADKAVKTGTLRNLHKWFAPMPLPAWRALLFAALLDDPEDDNKRVYLLDVMKRLVANGADLPDDETLKEARDLILDQFPEGVPAVMDPFCGGGSTLVEAQRLGLPSYGSDLNPVPVLISRALTEVLPKTYGGQALNAQIRKGRGAIRGQLSAYEATPDLSDTGYEGLIRDVSYYADRIGEKARKVLAPHYPIRAGDNPIAWLWTRTASCPNPACGIETVLTSSWWLSKKKNELAWLAPSVEDGRVSLSVVQGQREGEAPPSPKIGDGVFACVACSATLDGDYLRSEGKGHRMGHRMVAVITERSGKRFFEVPSSDEVEAALEARSHDVTFADIPINVAGQGVRVGHYGMTKWRDIFTERQLLALSTYADLVADVHDSVRTDGGGKEWADAVATLLGLAVGKMAQYGSTQTFLRTRNGPSAATAAFGRNDLPMMWDYIETAPLGTSVGSWLTVCTNMLRSLKYAPSGEGVVVRGDARTVDPGRPCIVATDPPYFDAIGYADHSDFFYVWHRRALKKVHPDLYATLAAPKVGELTAIPSHHGNDAKAARDYFIDGFTETFRNLSDRGSADLPMLVVYASKEQKGGREEETRWSSILTAMIGADLEITGTWPIHGTTQARMISAGTNAVASYIVMVCRTRPESAVSTSLSDFNRALRRELGPAVHDLQAASILPVDLAQAALGPGMQIFSRYRAVLDQSGQHIPVDHALRLINLALGEVLEEQEGELDPESRFAVRWWETHGWNTGPFGEADKTARPLGLSVDDAVRAAVATSQANKVQLLGNGELDHGWSPSADIRPTAWEAVHHLAYRLISGGGELEAARLMAVLGDLRDPAMALVYRLHDIAAKKGRTGDQERYNALINSWAEILRLSGDAMERAF